MRTIFGFILLVGTLFTPFHSLGNLQQTKEVVRPYNIQKDGADLLEKIQGQWVGKNKVLSWDFEWFSFDFRAVSSSHVFAIFEGGTMGNLLTSFFVTNYQNTKTIMARNGGVLNGIYRTSYFVLDSVHTSSKGKYYRLVDAIGGAQVMYMELLFKSDSLFFRSYTSRLGLKPKPTRHMDFIGVRNNDALSNQAAEKYSFPSSQIEWDMAGGFRKDYLYKNPSDTVARSATFLSEGKKAIEKLALYSGDPITISDHKNMGFLQVKIKRSWYTRGRNVMLYLSYEPLTEKNGLMNEQAFNSILLFPEIVARQKKFRFTYLHEGSYYLTAIADMDGSSSPTEGDILQKSFPIQIKAGKTSKVILRHINKQN